MTMSRIVEAKKCHIQDGEVIAKCMGTAAALGCGKSNEAVLSYCTCDRVPHNDGSEHLRITKLCDRVTRLEKELAELKAANRKNGIGWMA